MYEELTKRLREVEEMLKMAQFKEATILIEQAADAIEEPKWIPVAERLPEIGTYIIAGRMKYAYEKVYTHFVDVAYFGPRWNDVDYSW